VNVPSRGVVFLVKKNRPDRVVPPTDETDPVFTNAKLRAVSEPEA